MKLLVAIPSKNRTETLMKYTWSWAKDLNQDVKIFVEPQDFPLYVEAGFPADDMIELDKNDQGLGYAKRFIQEYAFKNGYDVIFKLDDDTRGFTDFRKKIPTEQVPELVDKVLSEVMNVFEENENLGAVAFPYSFHLFDEKKWEKVKKVQSSYLVRTGLLCPPHQFSVFEDFAVGLNCLVSNFKVMKYGLIGQDVGVKVGAGTGGLQDFDRSALAEKEAELLRTMYPPLMFKKVDKPWKIEPDMRSIKL